MNPNTMPLEAETRVLIDRSLENLGCAFLIMILSRGQSHDEKLGIGLSINIKSLKTYRYLKVIFISF